MSVAVSPRSLRLSPPALGLIIGTATGLVDLVLVATGTVHGGGGNAYLPLWACPTIVWTWTTIGGASGLLFAWPRLGRLRAIPLAFGAPGLLLLSRFGTEFKERTGLSTFVVLLAWAAVMLGL